LGWLGSILFLLAEATMPALGQPVYQSHPPPGSTIDFGNVAVYSISPQVDANGNQGLDIFIQDRGNQVLHVAYLRSNISGPDAKDFLVPSSSDRAVYPGGSGLGPTGLGVFILFLPSKLGTETATWKIVSNDPQTPVATYILKGTGVQPIPAVSSAMLIALAMALMFAAVSRIDR
jgi:hypothetical protein